MMWLQGDKTHGERNEDYEFRPCPGAFAPVLPDLVAPRTRPLGPREAARQPAEGAHLLGLEPRPSRLLVPAHVARLIESLAGKGLSPDRPFSSALAPEARAHECAALVAVQLLLPRLL